MLSVSTVYNCNKYNCTHIDIYHRNLLTLRKIMFFNEFCCSFFGTMP